MTIHRVSGAVAVAVALAVGLATGGPVASSQAARGLVEAKAPGALAVSSRGQLYVLDVARDQILRLVAGGRFRVVAGTGRRGFSGDGGPAVNAAIAVDEQSGLAVAANGTVYFADTGNGRVRAVAPNGVITTVAGGGATVPGTARIQALRARFAGIAQVNGLAIGPRGELLVGANGVYRLANGVLTWLVGSSASARNRGFGGYGRNPARQADFVPAVTLAVDGRGDVLVGGGNTWSLYERTTRGALRFVQGDRAPGGYYAAMARAPDVSVVLAGGARGLARFLPTGRITGIAAGSLASVLPGRNHFTAGDGVAVARSGVIYLDNTANNGFSSVGAIVRLDPSGHATLLWHS